MSVSEAFYLDTSLLVPAVFREPLSEEVLAWLENAAPGSLALSSWSHAELTSAIGRLVRMKLMRPSVATRTLSTFRNWASKAFVTINPTRADFDRAALMLDNFAMGLRAPDALHLAIVANRRDLTLVTFDAGLSSAARKLDIAVLSSIS